MIGREKERGASLLTVFDVSVRREFGVVGVRGGVAAAHVVGASRVRHDELPVGLVVVHEREAAQHPHRHHLAHIARQAVQLQHVYGVIVAAEPRFR